jgi:peptidoglycan/xylan/chitin deacetylase (PgdA/CDA1 family)
MIFLVVNYHYVSAEEPEAPRAIFPTSVALLERQLEAIGRELEFVSREDVLAAVAGERRLPERACLVTFDDGLREQFELALPVLVRLGVPALFFVPALPFAEDRALYVHKTHRLRELVADDELLVVLDRVLLEAGLPWPRVGDDAAVATYPYDTIDAARLKYLLSAGLPMAQRESILDRLLAEVAADGARLRDTLYMSIDQVAALERDHRALGAHGYSHRPLAWLSADELWRELELSARWHESVAGRKPLVLSYPHGMAADVSVGVAAACRRAGYAAGFTMESAFNRTLEEPLLLARHERRARGEAAAARGSRAGSHRPRADDGGSPPLPRRDARLASTADGRVDHRRGRDEPRRQPGQRDPARRGGGRGGRRRGQVPAPRRRRGDHSRRARAAVLPARDTLGVLRAHRLL